MGVLRALHTALTSVRLAVVLIALIIVVAILGTLLPQEMPGSWYESRYSPAVAAGIRALHLDRLYRSAVFLAPVALFCMSLATCTADRLVRRARTRAPRRFGPDLIHLGLLVLVAAGLVSALGRQEVLQGLAQGDTVDIGSGYRLHLLSLQSLRYDDGRPRQWISTVRVARGGRVTVASFPIQVNHPLRLSGLTVYQAGWDADGTIHLRDSSGRDVSPPQPGDYFLQGDSRWVFDSFQRDEGRQRSSQRDEGRQGGSQRDEGQPDDGAAGISGAEVKGAAWTAVFKRFRGRRLEETRTLRPGDSVGPFTVIGIDARELTGLKAVHDPGMLPFLAAAVLVVGGLGLTFLQRRGEAST